MKSNYGTAFSTDSARKQLLLPANICAAFSIVVANAEYVWVW
jgi:hypothetical protein